MDDIAQAGHVETPFGTLVVSSSLLGLCQVMLLRRHPVNAQPNRLAAVTAAACEQLERYVVGELQAFSLPLDLSSGSSFEQRVWRLTMDIPYGHTRSYGQIARALGMPDAARAVGRALNHNPLLIVVPCHRVIESSGGLGGFGAGMQAKLWLLGREGSPFAAARPLWGNQSR